MFTIDQIKEAHSKVKSGADFPGYIHDIKQLGVSFYETYVSDNHTDYHGAKGYKTTSPAKYESLSIADQANPEQFRLELKAHQQGKSDYLTFCKTAASLGVEKWCVSIDEMTCTYYDKAKNVLLRELIPQSPR